MKLTSRSCIPPIIAKIILRSFENSTPNLTFSSTANIEYCQDDATDYTNAADNANS
jgi:hypothetical protein